MKYPAFQAMKYTLEKREGRLKKNQQRKECEKETTAGHTWATKEKAEQQNLNLQERKPGHDLKIINISAGSGKPLKSGNGPKDH